MYLGSKAKSRTPACIHKEYDLDIFRIQWVAVGEDLRYKPHLHCDACGKTAKDALPKKKAMEFRGYYDKPEILLACPDCQHHFDVEYSDTDCLGESRDIDLRAEIQRLAAAYPTYGYRRITKLLAPEGHTVGYKRVARLMKEENLSVLVKRVCQTTRSLDRMRTLEISRQDQVWVGDITYVRLKGRFIYVALLMDVFTRMIRGWHLSQQLTQSLTLRPLKAALHQRGSPKIHHSDQGV